MASGARLIEITSDWLLRAAPRLCRGVAVLAAALVAAPLLHHLTRGSNAYLGLFEDDYFYYAIIADKFVTLGKLTYDGSTLTNGFHPLWFLVLLVLRLLAGGLNGAFYVILTAVLFASMIATYELTRAFARALGASALVSPAISALYCVTTNSILSSGMETALDVPLLLLLLVEVARTSSVTPRRAAKLGLFLASLAVLSRLDLALLVAMLLVGFVVFARPGLSQLWRPLAAFCAAGAAVPIYAVANLIAFGSVLPVSGLAKQLVKRPGLNVSYLYVVAFGSPYGKTTGVLLVLGVAAAFVLWRRRRAQRDTGIAPQALLAAAAALGFMGVFCVFNALSGWTYFGWYGYPLGPALVASLTLLGAVLLPLVARALRPLLRAAVVAASCAIASVQAVAWFVTRGPLWSVDDNGLLAMSIELADRMRDRHGVFAMGAIGGIATYVLGEPVVQLEGLVCDRAMVEHIRREDDLGRVLEEYHVDYLVVSLHHARMEKHDGCYEVTQPNAEWAGKRVARMRTEICAEPIVFFRTRLPQHPWSMFQHLDTYVFDVREGRGRRR